MSTDRELLEAAARAAGFRINEPQQADRDAMGCEHAGLWLHYPPGNTAWNPLTDDGDALRLAVKLYLWDAIRMAHRLVSNDTDIYAATRRAIVKAAAACAKDMSPSGPRPPGLGVEPEEPGTKERAQKKARRISHDI